MTGRTCSRPSPTRCTASGTTTSKGYLDNGDLIVREERGFVPGDELRSEAQRRNGADLYLYVLYGHWQLLSLATVVNHLSSSTPLLALGRGLDEFRKAHIADASCAPDPGPLRRIPHTHI